MHALASLLLLAAAGAAAPLPHDVTLLPGEFVPNRQPDGNSILLDAPDGVIVIDTGRHAEHTARILDAARARGRPIVAVINTHWHLDHISGNAAVRDAFPGVQIHASAALGDAQRGFLANYRRQLDDAISHGKDPAQQESWREEIARIDAGPKLAPDHVVAHAEALRIGGRRLELHLEDHSVTAGDVWVFDPSSKVLIAGDLVTLPAPLLDTACPAHWRGALAHLAQTRFTTVLPGHGAALDRAGFEHYRTAFDHLLACAASDAAKTACIDGWLADAQTLVPEAERDFARHLLDYYIDNSLRAPKEKTAPLCGA